MFDMGRREFITLLGGAAAAWPLAARAQQVEAADHWIAGRDHAFGPGQMDAAFVQRLHELGWVEGRNVAIEYRWVEGRTERSPEIIAEFVRLKVDVIVTHDTPTVLAAKQVTSVIPIVFPRRATRSATRLPALRDRAVMSRACRSSRPTSAKGTRAVARAPPESPPLGDLVHNSSPAALEMDAVQSAAGTLGLDVATVEVRQCEDIAPAIEALKDGAEALIVPSEPLTTPTELRSIRWRWGRSCRRSTLPGIVSKRAA